MGCDKENGFCNALESFFEDDFDQKGIHQLDVVTKPDYKMKCVGVGYKPKKKGKFTAFNFCPFCGEKINWLNN